MKKNDLHRSRVRIPYKPEFFSGFLFATAEVAFITAMIYFHIIHNFNNKKVGTSKFTHNSV